MIIEPPKYPFEDSPAKFKRVITLLQERGYKRILKRAERQFHRASWSVGDFQHLIIPDNGGGGQGLALQYGLYNEELEQFSVDCIVGYNRLNPVDWTKSKRSFCMLANSIFTRAKQGPGKAPWGIFLCDHTTDEIIKIVEDKLDLQIEPALRSVTDMQTWFNALADDSNAFPWWQVSAEVRAAQAVALGARLSMNDQDIKDRLMLQKAHIEGHAESGVSGDEYLDYVIAAAVKFRPN